MNGMEVKAPHAPVFLSSRAAEEIRILLETKNVPDGFGLRVGVRGGGCSGMSYILGFDKQREHDVRFEVEGITVLMDKRHGLYMMGTTIDYQDGLNARGFTFDNPNATRRADVDPVFQHRHCSLVWESFKIRLLGNVIDPKTLINELRESILH